MYVCMYAHRQLGLSMSSSQDPPSEPPPPKDGLYTRSQLEILGLDTFHIDLIANAYPKIKPERGSGFQGKVYGTTFMGPRHMMLGQASVVRREANMNVLRFS